MKNFLSKQVTGLDLVIYTVLLSFVRSLLEFIF